MKPNKDAAKSASIGCPIATTGEVFAGGAMIELVGGVHPARPQLMLLHESKEVVGPVVEYNGQLYEPAQIDSSILEQMTLPACCRPHGTTREFLSEVCSLMTNLVGLGEKS